MQTKQTAVEWLVEKHFGGIDNCTPDFRYHIKQAKEMEKQQIIDAYETGDKYKTEISGEQYYNEQFKNK
jgi:hypothetical protein